MTRSGHRREALPKMGPAAGQWPAGLLARVTEPEFCEHVPEDFAFWIATRPSLLVCEFCSQAAQVLAGDIRCAACRQPAGDPDTDAVVVARIAPWLGACFYLCSACTELDLRHTQLPG